MYCVLGNDEVKRTFGKPKHRRDDNIKINLTEITL